MVAMLALFKWIICNIDIYIYIYVLYILRFIHCGTNCMRSGMSLKFGFRWPLEQPPLNSTNPWPSHVATLQK